MKKLLLPACLFILLAASCKKEETNNNPVTTSTFKTYGSIEEVFNAMKLQPKVVTFDAAAGNSFYGNSGTRYIFKPNCFIDASGATVTGNVQVEVTEWLKKGDMIFSGMLPLSYGDRLVSGGEINVRATKNGSELFIKPGMSFQANVPQAGTADTTMSLFRGMANENNTTDRVNWAITKPDTASFMKYYRDTIMVICDSFNFWNCDHFGRDSNLQNFKVSLAATGATITATSNLNTYALFAKENSLLSLYKLTGSSYTVDYVPAVPMFFVSFGLINGHFYGGVSTSTTPKTGDNYTVTLTEVDPAAFKGQLNGLY